LSHPRVSPRGDLVAFLEHPMRGSDAGSVAVVGADGRPRVLSAGWTTLRGLAWSPDGGEVWFTAASVGGSRALHAVSLAGRRRLVLRVPGALTLHDVSREGRVLLAHEHAREGIAGVSPGEAAERAAGGGPAGGGDHVSLGRDGRGRGSVVRRLRARDRRVARRETRRRPRAGALARREVGALDAAVGARAARASADRSGHAARD